MYSPCGLPPDEGNILCSVVSLYTYIGACEHLITEFVRSFYDIKKIEDIADLPFPSHGSFE